MMAFNWIVATLCFYGLSLNAGIGSNVFSAFSLSAAMEIPAYIFSALVRHDTMKMVTHIHQNSLDYISFSSLGITMNNH